MSELLPWKVLEAGCALAWVDGCPVQNRKSQQKILWFGWNSQRRSIHLCRAQWSLERAPSWSFWPRLSQLRRVGTKAGSCFAWMQLLFSDWASTVRDWTRILWSNIQSLQFPVRCTEQQNPNAGAATEWAEELQESWFVYHKEKWNDDWQIDDGRAAIFSLWWPIAQVHQFFWYSELGYQRLLLSSTRENKPKSVDPS